MKIGICYLGFLASAEIVKVALVHCVALPCFRVSGAERESCQDGEAVVQDIWQQGDEDSDVGAGCCRKN